MVRGGPVMIGRYRRKRRKRTEEKVDPGSVAGP